MAGFSGGEEIGGICVGRYLGVVNVNCPGGITLGEDIILPFYGGVALSYGNQDTKLYEYADDLFNPCDCGYLAVAVTTDVEGMRRGEVYGDINVLGAVGTIEEAAQKYCDRILGDLLLKSEHCDDEAPEIMWGGSVSNEVSGYAYVTTVDEWEMSLDNLWRNKLTKDLLVYTEVPRQVIERRGINVLGPGWISTTTNRLPKLNHVSESKMYPGMYTNGGVFISHEVLRIYNGKVFVC